MLPALADGIIAASLLLVAGVVLYRYGGAGESRPA